MSAHLRPRDYQSVAVDSVFRAWADGMRRPAIVMATGLGKTIVFAELIRQWRTAPESIGAAGLARISKGERVIVLVHTDELCDQAIAKIRAVAPDLSVGKVKAQDQEIHADVMVCSVQTVSRHRRRVDLVNAQLASGPIGLIVTDEAHHAPSASYQFVYDGFPEALQLGVTATMERGDGVGLGTQWEDVVFRRSILNGIAGGHLVDVRALNVDVAGMELDRVRVSKGDYQAADLGHALEDNGGDMVIAKAYREYASDRPGIVFTPTVATAELTRDALRDAGFTSAAISGGTPREERQQIFEDFRTGRVQVLTNCMVLTEGFDSPWASCAVIARPTRSQPLFVQMVGRVLRPWPSGGKKDALVLNLNGAGGKLTTLIDLEPGLVESVKDGETLTEAIEREEAEGHTLITRGHPAFGLKMSEVNLFAASGTAWLSTAGGVMFIGAGEWTYFLWPSKAEAGGWDVLRKQKRGRWERTPHTGLTAELAMSWAEAEAENHGSFSTSRKASWRGGKPTQPMLDFAYTLGIDTAGMGKAAVSDAISYVLESRALDPYIGVV